jgi:hypothetical protein
MIGLIFDTNCFKILSLFAVFPESGFRRNEVKEKTKLNNVPLDKALTKLLSSHVLAIENNVYILDLENKYTKRAVKLALRQYRALNELPFDLYLLLIDLVEGFSSIKGLELYLADDPSKSPYQKSSIEITIITPKEVDKKSIAKTIKKLTTKYRKQVEVHDFIAASFYKNPNDPKVIDLMEHGIKLI